MTSPVDSAFVKGHLTLPSVPGTVSGYETVASPISDVMALLSLLVIITLLRRLVEIFPSLIAGIIRWKESVNLFNSVRLSRDRNMIALSLVVPFCIIIYRTGLYSPAFLNTFTGDARFGLITGIIIGYIITRALLEKMCAPKKRNSQMYWCACRSAYSFFILLVLLLLALWSVLGIFNVDDETVRSAMLWLSAAIYTIFILRKTQIFASSCSIFTAFLYLCALEILPTGALIASAVIL